MDQSSKKAVVLLSGGLDSATTLAIAKSRGFAIYAMTFDYGQRHAKEIERAREIAENFLTVEHKIIKMDLRVFGTSALTADIEVPKDRAIPDIGSGIPITYVPARNTIFLSFSLAWAEVLECFDIFIGANAIDYSGYPDCRPEYFEAYQRMANLATKAVVQTDNVLSLHTPLIGLTKAEIIKKGTDLGVDYSKTLSCYDPSSDGEACGACDSCLLRKKGFKEARISDPTPYKIPRGQI